MTIQSHEETISDLRPLERKTPLEGSSSPPAAHLGSGGLGFGTGESLEREKGYLFYVF